MKGKCINNNPINFSEAEMADAFYNILQSKNGLPSTGPFDGIYRETTCRLGRPDFITLRNKSIKPIAIPKLTGFVDPSILNILKPRSPRTLNYLIKNTEFSLSTIKRSLQRLIAFGYVECTPTGAYHLGNAAPNLELELWCFELKLNNPKRALFQAQQSRIYADCAIIVVPFGQEKHYACYTESMKRWNIGLGSFDPHNQTFEMFHRTRPSKAFNREYKIYALSQLM